MYSQPWLRLAVRIVVVAALVAEARPALCQEQQQPPLRRPFRRIFGSAPERPNSQQRVDFTVNLSEAYDDNVLADQLAGGDPRFAESGYYTAGAFDLNYLRRLGRSGRGSFAAGGSTSLRYAPGVEEDPLDRTHSASVRLVLPLGSRTTLTAAEAASYSSFYTLLGLPGGQVTDPAFQIPGSELLAPGIATGIATEGTGAWAYDTELSLTRMIGRRHSLEGRYGWAHTEFSDRSLTVQSAGALYRHSITQQAFLRLGYSQERGQSTLDIPDPVFHDVNIGVDYLRSLPGSRNTTFSVSTGSAMVVSEGARDYRFLADARLTHLMGRSWAATLSYHRGFDFLAALADVVATDSLDGTISGFFNPRLEGLFSVMYTHGEIGSGLTPQPLTTLSVTPRLQYGISQRWAIDAQYIYYFYEFGQSAALPTGLPGGLTRNGVRVGMTILVF